MNSNASPIARLSLHGEVVTRLRDLIASGELRPGARIAERELCAQFGISRTPLREALKVLAAEGAVELLPHRGARVARLSADDVRQMFEVMGALEALAGELAAERIEPAELHAIEALHARMAASHARRALRPYFEDNAEIHRRIVAAARNDVLRDAYAGLSGRIARARYVANMSEQRWAEAMGEHEAMLAALRARDGAALAALLRTHLAHKSEVVLREFSAEKPAAAEAG